MPDDVDSLTEILTNIADRVSENRDELSERDVETIFFDESFFSELGFDTPGVDVQQERTLPGGTRPDVITVRDSSSVRAVYEFKEPTTSLDQHIAQLRDYVSELRADAGVLTNGIELWLFDGEEGSFHRITTLALFTAADESAASDIADIRAALDKDEWSFTNQADVEEYIAEVHDSPLNLDTEIAQTFFFNTFRFDRQGPFNDLIDSGMDLLDALREADVEFVTGAFEFWRRSYARLPDEDEVPQAWTRFVEEDGTITEAQLAEFMFTLESGFALLSRLFLTKAADDYGFFSDDPLQDGVPVRGGQNGDIEPPAYVELVTELFEELRTELIESLFEDDIFLWWIDGFQDVRSGPGEPEFGGLGAGDDEIPPSIEEPRNRFAEAVAQLFLSVFKFDFSRVDNVDLLGGLYQNYFDKDTRKALGEFYTPAGVVELILDRVAYVPGQGISNKRLADPACGSGTFVSDAIDRYLQDVRERADGDPDWQEALERLCLEPRIVGFDIHPFAVLMAQISVTLAILDPYKQAKRENESFTLRRLPIFRTDTLHKESHDPGTDLAGEGQQALPDADADDDDVEIPLELPLAVDGGSDTDDDATPFLETAITLPRYTVIRGIDQHGTGVDTYGDYFRVLLALLDVVKAHVAAGEESYTPECTPIAQAVESYLDNPIGGLEPFLEPYVTDLLDVVSELESREGGGRLLPIFEDVALSLIVKNYLSYDYVVANPPYVEANNIDSATKRELEAMYPETTTEKYDLYCPFYERGIDWLTEQGQLGYITPKQFMVTAYGQGVRSYLATETKLRELYDFRDSGVFADATNYPVVVIAEKGDGTPDSPIHCVRVKRVDEEDVGGDESEDGIDRPQFGSLQAQVPEEDRTDEPTTIDTSLDERVLQTIRDTFNVSSYSDAFIDVFSFPQSQLRDEYWCPMPADEWEIFTEIEEQADASLSGLLDLHAGTQTGANDIYIVTPRTVDRVDADDTGGTVEVMPKGGGQPVTLERDLLRPWLRGSDIKRWRPEWSGEHVLFPYERVQVNRGHESAPIDPADMQELEHTWAYLTRNRGALEQREGGMMEDEEHWYAFTAPKNHIELSKPKVMVAETASNARFAMDETGSWLFKSAYGAPYPPEFGDRRKYLTAYLNSNVFDFHLKHVSSLKSGGHYKYTTSYVGRVPALTEVPDEMRNTISSLVDDLLRLADTRQRIERFPESYLERVDGELRNLEYTWRASYTPIEEVEATVDPNMDYQVSVDDGSDVLTHQPIAAGGEEMARYVTEALRHRSVSEGATTQIPYPVDGSARSDLLAALREDQSIVAEIHRDEIETELNVHLYALFDFDKDQQETIETFLEAYSDRS